MGLGSARNVGLAEARTLAAEARLLGDKGIDPIEQAKADSLQPSDDEQEAKDDTAPVLATITLR